MGLKCIQDKSSNSNNTRRCILITDAESPVSDKITEVKNRFLDLNCKFEIFGVAFGLESKSNEGKKNEEKLKELVNEVSGEILAISQAMELLSECNRRTVRQTTKYRGPLKINEMLSINVFVYSKTMEEKLPSLKKISKLSVDDDESEGNVKMDRIYRGIDDPDNEVSEEYRIKAYRYGKDYIPFTIEDDLNMKYVSEKEMSILGFTNKNNICRYSYMSSCDIAVAAPMDENSQIGLSSLIEGCIESDRVIIIRFVKRNKSDPILCVLSPYIEYNNENEILYECFLINELPFGDDCRDYEFNSLLNVINNINSEENEIMKKLIESFDLSKINNNNKNSEIFIADSTFNPTIQRFNKSLEKRSIDMKCNIPALDSYMLRNYELINEMKKKRKIEIFDEINKLFPVEVVEHSMNNKKPKYWNKDENDKKIENLELAGDNNNSDSINENIFEYSAVSVSTMNACEDFNSMIKSINHELYKIAIEGMINVINKFLEEGGIIYDRKAKECIKAFRDGCIKIKESNKYNDELNEWKEKYKSRVKFWLDLKILNCGLIRRSESENVKVSDEECDEFWSWLEVKSSVVSSLSSESSLLVDEDSLLDDLL